MADLTETVGKSTISEENFPYFWNTRGAVNMRVLLTVYPTDVSSGHLMVISTFACVSLVVYFTQNAQVPRP